MKIGIKGISYSTTERKYLVRTKKNSKTIYVGRFSSLEEAKEALALCEGKTTVSSNTPILESLRASFASKKPKPSKHKTKTSKVKFQESTSKPTKVKHSSAIKVNKTNTKTTPKATNSNAQVTNKSNTQITQHDIKEAALHSIVLFLLNEADRKKTTVFDLVMQEVERLARFSK